MKDKLENHYRDMQDMEFTIQDGKLWILQTRNGKRTGKAMVKIAMDLLREGMITEEQALMRIDPDKLDELLHPVFDKAAESKAVEISQVFLPLQVQLLVGSVSLLMTRHVCTMSVGSV